MASLKAELEFKGWVLGKNLGSGGQANVYYVTRKDDPSNTTHVLKQLKNADSKQAYARFYREIESLKKLEKPGVAKIIASSDLADVVHFYVMEYHEDARSLQKIVSTPSNPYFCQPEKAVNFYIKILEALAVCEEMKIVHRDLSLGNILHLKNGGALLIDFGCCYVQDNESVTLVDEAIGTPAYRAPECEGHGDAEPTSSADLYSAAKILWSLVTNRKAFNREDPVFKDLSLVKALPNTPMAWHLHHIFEKAIRRDPAQRCKSITEAIGIAHWVLSLIQLGYLPLEEINKNRCPICGVGFFRNSDVITRIPGAADIVRSIHSGVTARPLHR